MLQQRNIHHMHATDSSQMRWSRHASWMLRLEPRVITHDHELMSSYISLSSRAGSALAVHVSQLACAALLWQLQEGPVSWCYDSFDTVGNYNIVMHAVINSLPQRVLLTLCLHGRYSDRSALCACEIHSIPSTVHDHACCLHQQVPLESSVWAQFWDSWKLVGSLQIPWKKQRCSKSH